MSSSEFYSSDFYYSASEFLFLNNLSLLIFYFCSYVIFLIYFSCLSVFICILRSFFSWLFLITYQVIYSSPSFWGWLDEILKNSQIGSCFPNYVSCALCWCLHIWWKSHISPFLWTGFDRERPSPFSLARDSGSFSNFLQMCLLWTFVCRFLLKGIYWLIFFQKPEIFWALCCLTAIPWVGILEAYSTSPSFWESCHRFCTMSQSCRAVPASANCLPLFFVLKCPKTYKLCHLCQCSGSGKIEKDRNWFFRQFTQKSGNIRHNLIPPTKEVVSQGAHS